MTMSDDRRALPAVGTLADSVGVRELCPDVPRSLVIEAVRTVVNQARSGATATPDDDAAWAVAVAAEIQRRSAPTLRPVINATGVVLHTNLGRAPLAKVALDAIVQSAGGSSNLEYDLARGERGSRYDHCVALLQELTGAEDALVVNNGAAALVLALNTLAEGREAIISRGELIEIGGSFRVPDIMARSGASLREVGTTNRTHVADYRDALGETTGVVVKVHRSNFEVRGFVAEATLRELAPVAREAGVPLLFDFGSGLLMSLEAFGLGGEPVASDALRDGASVVVMSGDKLLGGPQAGIMLGSREVIGQCRRNPLTRALRVDKLTIAALSATLALYRDPPRALREIPTLAMLTTPEENIRRRADAVAVALRSGGVEGVAVPSEASVGGGAFPTARLASWAVALGGDVSRIAALLRDATPPVVGHIGGGRLLLDLRSVPPREDRALAASVLSALHNA